MLRVCAAQCIYVRNFNSQVGRDSENFTPRKLIILANMSISQEVCAAKIWSYTVSVTAYKNCCIATYTPAGLETLKTP